MDVARRLTEVEDAVGEPFERRACQACSAARLSTDCAKVDVEPAMPTRGDAFDDEFAIVAEASTAKVEVVFRPPIVQHPRLPKVRERFSKRREFGFRQGTDRMPVKLPKQQPGELEVTGQSRSRADAGRCGLRTYGRGSWPHCSDEWSRGHRASGHRPRSGATA